MASSISILSLFVLVLISGYFTFPLDNFSSEPSPLAFENEFTTAHNFNARATIGDDFFTTPSKESTSSVTEPFSWEFTTITGDIKRSVDGGSDIFATTVEYEFTTDAQRRERMTEDFSTVESSTFIDITGETPKKEHEMKPVSDIVEERTTKRGEIVESGKRALVLGLPLVKETSSTQSPSEFTSFATTLFTSTSSHVAPKFYTQTSTEFSPIELTTQKYVGSLRKDDDDEKSKPHEKEDEEERKPEKQQETSVDSDKEKDSKKKLPKSNKNDSSESDEDSKEKYATGQLLDQDSSKSFQQRPQGFAILVESDTYYTSVIKEPAEEARFTSESTKLTQGEESTQAQ